MSADDDDPPETGAWARGPSPGAFAMAHLDQARAFLHARNFDAAIRDAERVLERDPNGRYGFLALDIIADAHWEKDDYQTVVKIGRELLYLDPERIHGYIQLARGALQSRDMRTAIDAIERGLEVDPECLALVFLNSHRFQQAHDYARGIEWAEKAVALAPHYVGSLTTLAHAYGYADRPDDAAKALDAARELDPMSSHVFSASAFEAMRANKFGDVETFAVEALKRDPQNNEARLLLKRARTFGKWIMRPYWWLNSLSMTGLLLFAVVVTIIALPLAAIGVGRILWAPLALYYMGCMMTVMVVNHTNRLDKPQKPPKLKNY